MSPVELCSYYRCANRAPEEKKQVLVCDAVDLVLEVEWGRQELEVSRLAGQIEQAHAQLSWKKMPLS